MWCKVLVKLYHNPTKSFKIHQHLPVLHAKVRSLTWCDLGGPRVWEMIFCWTSLTHTDLYWFSCVEGISRFHASKNNRKICPCPWKLAMGSTRWSPSHFHSLLVARAFAVRPAFHSSQHSWSQGAFINWNAQCWRCEHVRNSGCLLTQPSFKSLQTLPCLSIRVSKRSTNPVIQTHRPAYEKTVKCKPLLLIWCFPL